MLAAPLLAALAASAAPGQEVERWEAALVVSPDGARLAFGLELERTDEGTRAFLVNDPERIEVPAVAWSGQALVLDLPHYRSRVEARWDASAGGLVGTWTKVRGAGRVATVPFEARHAAPATPRDAGGRGEPADREAAERVLSVAGRWAVDFETDELPAVALLEQEQGSRAVRGTFLTATGDHRFLAGTLEGRSLTLSCFDGAHAFLYQATLDAEGRLAGTFRSGDWWSERWTAARDDDAAVADGFAQTTWSAGVSAADLVFPDPGDPDGRLVAVADLLGTGTLLVVLGTWCPNCNDEAALLAELHDRYASRGLEVVGLAFELTGSFDEDALQVRRFRERHGLRFPLLLAGTADKEAATHALGALDRVRSFPTTIFLGADGGVRGVHSGYAGPATGAAHADLRARFEERIEALLAEPAPDDAPLRELLAGRTWRGREGTLAFSLGEDGALGAALEPAEGGAPIALDARVRAGSLWLDGRLLRLDARARVLLDPLDAGGRLSPEEDPTPALAALGSGETAELVALLASDDPFLRREALVALAARGVAPEPPLLDDPDLGVLATAAWAAGRAIVPPDEGTGRALAALLEHPNAAVRREAARSLAGWVERADLAGEGVLREALAARRDDPDPLVRSAVR